MEVFKFHSYIKENNTAPVQLFRVVAVGSDENLVVNTKNPGKYYFRSESDINVDVLKKVGSEYHVIKVTTSESNIDKELSEEETTKHGCECVVLKDDSQAKLKEIVPLNK